MTDELFTAQEVEVMLAQVRDRARAQGRDEGALRAFKSVASANGSTAGVLAVLKGTFSEDKVKRDHGKFSSSGGGKGDASESGATGSDSARRGSGTAHATHGADGAPGGAVAPAGRADSHPADAKARTLAARIAEVPHAVKRRVTAFITGKYEKLKARYGEAGAKAVMGAMVLLVGVPLPGTSLVPIAVAEAVLRIRKGVAAALGKAMGDLTEDHARALARDLLHELYEGEGEDVPQEDDADVEAKSLPPDAAPDDAADDTDPDGTDLYDDPDTTNRALLVAMVEAVHDAIENGEDPEAVAEQFRALIDDPELLRRVAGGTVGKAWDTGLHPRDDHGRFVSRDAIHDAKVATAKGDDSKAEALRARVTSGIEREKLDAALEGKSDLGRTQAHKNREAAAGRRATKEESKARAHELISKVQRGVIDGEPVTAADLHALADHLPNMTVADLRRARLWLGTNLKGDRKKADIAERIKQHVLGEAYNKVSDPVPASGLLSAGRRAAIANKPTTQTDAEDAGVMPPPKVEGRATGQLASTAIRNEVREYRKIGLSPGDINSGECAQVATRVVTALREKGIDAKYGTPSGTNAHVWVVAGGRHYDAQHPDGVADPAALTFFRDNPDLLADGWKQTASDPVLPGKTGPGGVTGEAGEPPAKEPKLSAEASAALDQSTADVGRASDETKAAAGGALLAIQRAGLAPPRLAIIHDDPAQQTPATSRGVMVTVNPAAHAEMVSNDAETRKRWGKPFAVDASLEGVMLHEFTHSKVLQMPAADREAALAAADKMRAGSKDWLSMRAETDADEFLSELSVALIRGKTLPPEAESLARKVWGAPKPEPTVLPKLTTPPKPAKKQPAPVQAAPAKFGTAGASHPIKGATHGDKTRAVGQAFGFGADTSDPMRLVKDGPPPDLDMNSFRNDVRGVISRHQGAIGVGPFLPDLYAAVGPKHDLSKHDFLRAVAALSHRGDKSINLSAWGKTVSELPDPELAPVIGRLWGSAHLPEGGADPTAGDTSLNTAHPAVVAKYGKPASPPESAPAPQPRAPRSGADDAAPTEAEFAASAKPASVKPSASVSVADVYDRAGSTAKHSEVNAAVRAAAAMSRPEATAALKQMGYPASGDPRKQLAELILDRKGSQLRRLSSGAGEAVDAAHREAYKPLHDEPLISASELFPTKPQTAAKPAKVEAPKPVKPAQQNATKVAGNNTPVPPTSGGSAGEGKRMDASRYRFSGNTFDHKDAIKSLGRATFYKGEWIVEVQKTPENLAKIEAMRAAGVKHDETPSTETHLTASGRPPVASAPYRAQGFAGRVFAVSWPDESGSPRYRLAATQVTGGDLSVSFGKPDQWFGGAYPTPEEAMAAAGAELAKKNGPLKIGEWQQREVSV